MKKVLREIELSGNGTTNIYEGTVLSIEDLSYCSRWDKMTDFEILDKVKTEGRLEIMNGMRTYDVRLIMIDVDSELTMDSKVKVDFDDLWTDCLGHEFDWEEEEGDGFEDFSFETVGGLDGQFVPVENYYKDGYDNILVVETSTNEHYFDGSSVQYVSVIIHSRDEEYLLSKIEEYGESYEMNGNVKVSFVLLEDEGRFQPEIFPNPWELERTGRVYDLLTDEYLDEDEVEEY